ncbi:MAG TPA: anti-sigma factor [Puia sp.]|jgi:anti-sigma-K factor RskA
MGLASESERAEFEHLCTQYPELVAARRDFEERLEEYASEHAVAPPPAVKVKVLEAIGNQRQRQTDSPITPSSNPPKIITMENSKSPVRSPGWLRFIAAASILLLVGMAWLYYQTNTQNKELSSTNDRLKEKLNSTDSILKQIVAEEKMVKDPNTTVVNMVGTQVAPRSSANIYWDSTSTNVFLVVKNMPKLPSDQQYQLWALIDGKPNDLGVFDATDDKVILKMKNTRKAQAFAITIEKKGGSPSPTLQKMQSLGKTIQTQ